MKTALIRLLTLVTLATSMSAFAVAGESKHNDAAAATRQDCKASQDKKQKNAQKTQEESQQEQEFDRVLMGIYG